MMKSLKDSTVKPRRKIPCIVGILGSSQPLTKLLLTNHANFLFDNKVYLKLSLEKLQIGTFLMFKAFWNHAYCASLSAYSEVLKAWVTPSIESTIGHEKSYVG